MEFWQKDTNTATLKFYGYIGNWYQGADDFEKTIRAIEAKYANLHIKLHCYGGSVIEGNAMYHALSQTKLHVTIDIEGVSASMSMLFMLPAKKIRCARNGLGMIHAPSSGVSGQSKDFYQMGKLLKLMEKNFSREIKNRSKGKISDELLAEWMDGSDYWLSAEDMLGYGLIDEIIDPIDTSNVVIGKPDAGTDMKSVFEKFTALTKFPIQLKTNRSMDNQTIIAALNLTSVTAESSETALLDVLKGIQAENIALKANAITASKSLAETLIAAKEKELNTTLKAEEKASYITVAETAGIEVLKSVLASVKPTPIIASMIFPETKPNLEGGTGAAPAAEARKDWDLDKWSKQDPEGLESLSNSELPEQKALFAKLYSDKFPNAKS
ncbi:MAG: Clp protease ClpP [Sphingobacteriia bacterium]|nr:MAG: Clp protease ClpP [Sphingobacteriia bacterium]